MIKEIRLDKLLSDAGIGTRSEVKSILKKKIVTVNGKITSDGGTKVNPEGDNIAVCGESVNYREHLYFMLNKPAGVVSATRDGLSETVIACLKGEPTKNLFPVGRLDKDTEGLLLITSDGSLAHELLSPKKHVEKTYFAVTSKLLNPVELENFRKGVDIGDERLTLPAKIELTEKDSEEGYLVTICEGRYHQIKRMFEAFGSEVVFLKRLSMGELKLDESLRPGEYRSLTEEELDSLKKRAK